MKDNMSDAPTPKLSKKQKPEVINARLFDLCRYQRSELFEAELITEDEYMFLMHDCSLAKGGGSPSPRRLESYDKIRDELTAAREDLDQAADDKSRLATMAMEFKEQRDRLAEALDIDPYPDEPIADDLQGGNTYCEISVHEMRKIRQSLQSLTTNDELA